MRRWLQFTSTTWNSWWPRRRKKKRKEETSRQRVRPEQKICRYQDQCWDAFMHFEAKYLEGCCRPYCLCWAHPNAKKRVPVRHWPSAAPEPFNKGRRMWKNISSNATVLQWWSSLICWQINDYKRSIISGEVDHMFWWRLSFTLGALPLMVPLLSVIPRLLVQLPFCVWDLPTSHLLLSRPRTVMGLGWRWHSWLSSS